MTDDPDVPDSSADGDAMKAWSFAVSLAGASPERRAATVKLVLAFLDSDAGRIVRAAAICRARRDGDADDLGWGAAADLLDQALALLHEAGAENEGGRARFAEQLHRELHPDPQPYTWPDRSDRRRGWPRRLLHHARLRWQHTPPRGTEAGPRLLLLRAGGMTIGKLDYQICAECRRGYVRRLDVDDRYRGLGLGARAIRAVQRRHRGLRWRTTPHYPTAGTFWTTVAGRGGGFLADAEWPCRHMRETH
jgi:hypothetical protein